MRRRPLLCRSFVQCFSKKMNDSSSVFTSNSSFERASARLAPRGSAWLASCHTLYCACRDPPKRFACAALMCATVSCSPTLDEKPKSRSASAALRVSGLKLMAGWRLPRCGWRRFDEKGNIFFEWNLFFRGSESDWGNPGIRFSRIATPDGSGTLQKTAPASDRKLYRTGTRV